MDIPDSYDLSLSENIFSYPDVLRTGKKQRLGASQQRRAEPCTLANCWLETGFE